ncbi:hypothetical protein [Sporosarcina newyorkensis]|uniref:hypothetical protein n=1 Tax=Sporosarcina newyorkensis TaxID=759851 RepID=UPI003CFDF75C
MKIKQITSQNRRDFQAIYECEGCGHEHEGGGYDDRNFHDNVIPTMQCEKCNQSRNDLGIKGEVTQTKYPSWMTV